LFVSDSVYFVKIELVKGGFLAMMNRRVFLKTSAGLAAGGLFAMSPAQKPFREFASAQEKAKASAGKSLESIGLQLYTVRELMKKDFTGTLEKVAETGYKEVEFAGYFDHKPEDVKKLLDRLGLKAPAAHVQLGDFRNKLEATMATAKIVGHHYLVCPWLSPFERSLENYKAHAALFNKIGEACRKAGLQFAYHNHDFEFEAKDGQLPYDVLLAGTDAQLVQMEIDLFWIKKGGQDPLAYFEKHPGRFSLCHVKDMDEKEKMVDVGKGKIEFGKIFTRAQQAGLKHFFVEHDNPEDPLESIAASYQHLKNLKF
jgi:sugar phosphate isomerase/epimerase